MDVIKSERQVTVMCNEFGKRPSKPKILLDYRDRGNSTLRFARLSRRRERGVTFQCAGALIAKNFVLTAAHCCNKKYAQPVLVRLGKVKNEIFSLKDFSYVRPDFQASIDIHNMSDPLNHTDVAISVSLSQICIIRVKLKAVLFSFLRKLSFIQIINQDSNITTLLC